MAMITVDLARRLAAAGESFWDLTEAERKDAAERGLDAGAARVTAPEEGWEHDEDGSQPSGGVAIATDRRVETDPAPSGSAAAGLIGLAPILVIVAVNALCTYLVLPAMDFGFLESEKYGATSLAGVMGIWSVTVGMLAGILAIFVMQPGRVRSHIDGLTEGARNAVLPVFNTASEVGYGAVIASLAVFALIRDGIFNLSDNAIAVSALSTSGIAALTGSASGGLTITLDAFGQDLQQMAADQGTSMEVMHRVMAMASTGFDSLPHNGAIITLLLVCGLTHRESYKDIFAVTVVVPVIGLVAVAGLGMAFGAF